MFDAIKAPCTKICSNAGYTAGIVIDKVKKSEKHHGFNASSGRYGDMFELGIIDSYKVCRVALSNAISVSATLLTTECVISEIQDEK